MCVVCGVAGWHAKQGPSWGEENIQAGFESLERKWVVAEMEYWLYREELIK